MMFSLTFSMFIDPPLKDQKVDLSTIAPMVRRFYASDAEKIEMGNNVDELDEEQKEPLNKSSVENVNGK